MKRLLFVVTAGSFMALGLVACSNNSGTASGQNTQVPAAKTETARPVHEVHHAPATTQNGSMVSESNNTAKPAAKKGWSKAAKGATIGGVAGAVVGAVVDKKNRAAGAVIGGAAGAGVGYGIGRHQDKKDGRVQ
jgi:outer membrane lipoprotein SlyB